MLKKVIPTGVKWWRFRFTFDGKEKLLSPDTYPGASLKDARERRDANRKLLANGVNPSENRKMQKSVRTDEAANIFEAVTREWYAKYSATWSANRGNRIIRRFERDFFPWIGGQPITEINAPILRNVVRRIKSRGALETTHRTLGNCGQVFRYAVATGLS